LYLFQELDKKSRSLVSELNTRSLKDLRDIGIFMTACCRKLSYIVSYNFFIYLQWHRSNYYFLF